MHSGGLSRVGTSPTASGADGAAASSRTTATTNRRRPRTASATAIRLKRASGSRASGRQNLRAPDRARAPIPVDTGRTDDVQIECAECGCLVDRGVVVRRCDSTDCCCAGLPDRAEEVTREA